MNDPRYQAPVGGMSAPVLPEKLRAAMLELEKQFPGLGVTLFVFDYGGATAGGIGYISNARRDDMINAITEWLQKQRTRSN